jgi:uncharacterized protein DUF4384
MNIRRNQHERASTVEHRSSRRGDHLVLLLTTAVLALVMGVVTARAQDERLQDAMTKGWQGYENQVMRVNVWHDRDEDAVYREGESVRLHFETNLDAYAVAYRIDSEGEVSLLWPRSRLDDGFVFANHTYNLPAPGSRRLRTAGSEGIEYVQVLVSAYPFDLRNLEIDFHHEQVERPLRYYVAGDPYLAMNDINFEITGLEEAEDFVVANYTSWYVGSRVDHPRYLCSQCHDDDMERHPYRDTCTIEIHHNYEWDNDWYAGHGYYPVYHYPVYYYIDPWTWRPWVNYWYRPWYSWPSVSWGWGWDCYAWNYSPYGRGDVWDRYQDGSRRYRPLGKGVRYKEVAGRDEYRHPRALGKSARPSKSMKDAMTRGVAVKKPARTQVDQRKLTKPSRTAFEDISRTKRDHKKLPAPTRQERRGGLQIPKSNYPRTIGTGAVRSKDATATKPGTIQRGGTSRKQDGGRVRSTAPTRKSQDGPRVRPVEPRSKGSRIWNGGSSARRDGGSVKPPKTTPTRSRTERTPTVKPRKSNNSGSSSRPVVKPRSGSSKSKPVVKPRSSSSSKSSGKSQSSSKSSGSSKSKGGSSKRR